MPKNEPQYFRDFFPPNRHEWNLVKEGDYWLDLNVNRVKILHEGEWLTREAYVAALESKQESKLQKRKFRLDE